MISCVTHAFPQQNAMLHHFRLSQLSRCQPLTVQSKLSCEVEDAVSIFHLAQVHGSLQMDDYDNSTGHLDTPLDLSISEIFCLDALVFINVISPAA